MLRKQIAELRPPFLLQRLQGKHQQDCLRLSLNTPKPPAYLSGLPARDRHTQILSDTSAHNEFHVSQDRQQQITDWGFMRPEGTGKNIPSYVGRFHANAHHHLERLLSDLQPLRKAYVVHGPDGHTPSSRDKPPQKPERNIKTKINRRICRIIIHEAIVFLHCRWMFHEPDAEGRCVPSKPLGGFHWPPTPSLTPFRSHQHGRIRPRS